MRYNSFWVNLTVDFGLINLLFVPEKIVLAKSHVNSMLYIRALPLTELPSKFYDGCCCLLNIIIQ